MTIVYQVIQDTVLTGTSSIGIGASAAVTIRSAESGELVTLFQDRLGASGETNPFNADAAGQFRVYAAPGRLQISITHNAVTRVWEDFQLVSQPPKRNKIINAEHAVAQRGTSFAGIGANVQDYVTDRHSIFTQNGPQARATVTQEAGVFSGIRNSLKIDCTTAEAAVAANELWVYEYRIEAQDLQDMEYGAATARTFVLSFKIKSPKTGIHCVGFFQSDSTRSFVREFTISAANTEEEHVVTLPGDVSGVINNDNGDGLRIIFPLVAGSDLHIAPDAWSAGFDCATSNQQNLLDNTANNFEITALQFIEGDAKIPFEHIDIASEVKRCERYAEAFGHGVMGSATLTTKFHGGVSFRTEKRANPTLTVLDTTASSFRVTTSTADFDPSSVSVALVSTGTTGMRFSSDNYTGMTQFRAHQLISSAPNLKPMLAEAEL